jgi:hypothetical protein
MCAHSRTSGLAPRILEPFWTHVHPLLDHRPQQVPPQWWHSQGGAPPPLFTPQGWPIQGLMGLALLIIDPLWTHVRPLMDYRPNQVPLQRWQNQEGGPPLCFHTPGVASP